MRAFLSPFLRLVNPAPAPTTMLQPPSGEGSTVAEKGYFWRAMIFSLI
jgi:hypothetical protein